MTVLNPLRQIDERIMDDADMAGPIFFFLAFGVCLLLVGGLAAHMSLSFSNDPPCMQSGRSQFGYIYGIALLGSSSIYALLNLMSSTGIDAYRTASVLGYCLLPMVVVGALSVGRNLYVPIYASLEHPAADLKQPTENYQHTSLHPSQLFQLSGAPMQHHQYSSPSFECPISGYS